MGSISNWNVMRSIGRKGDEKETGVTGHIRWGEDDERKKRGGESLLTVEALFSCVTLLCPKPYMYPYYKGKFLLGKSCEYCIKKYNYMLNAFRLS